MRRLLRSAVWGLFLCLTIVAAGCGGSGGGSSSDTSSVDSTTSGAPAIRIVSGDHQEAAAGTWLDDPLAVLVTNASGDPIANITVNFSINSGKVSVSSSQVVTGPDGLASVKAKLGAGIGHVSIRAESLGVGSVAFTLESRLPLLGEIIDGATDKGPVAGMPVMLTRLGDDTPVLALVSGSVYGLDLNSLPRASDVVDAVIDGQLGEDLQAAILDAGALTDPWSLDKPLLSEMSGRTVDGEAFDNLPVALGFSVNGSQVALAITGDASAIPGTVPVGELLARNPIVMDGLDGIAAADLPVRLIDASRYPHDADPGSEIFIALFDSKAPTFRTVEKLGDKALLSAPVMDQLLSLLNLSLVDLTGEGSIPAVFVTLDNPPLDMCVPSGPLENIPAEYLPIVQIIENQLLPLGTETMQVSILRAQLYGDLYELIKANDDMLHSLLEGNEPDYTALLAFAVDALPIVDDIVKTRLTLLDIDERRLIVIKDDLLPEIAALVPPDGIPFGGYSDGIGSSVSGTVLPLTDDYLALALDAMPSVTRLFADIDTIIPDNGDLMALLANLQNGSVDVILADLDDIKVHVVAGMWMFNDRGIPILYDLLEEAEYRFPPGTLYVRDFECYTLAVEYLSSELPPETTLGDLPYYDQWGPYLEPYLPAEWGDPATVSVFDTVVPAIGDIDIGGDVLPLVRQGLDGFADVFPDVICAVEEFSFATIDIPNITLPF